MSSFASFARRQFRDHVDGGVHANITPEEAKGLPLHNMHLERGFGFWDRKKRSVPALSSLASEGCLLFTYNKTLEWLMKKPVDEREELVCCCQRQTPHMKATLKERAKKLQLELESRLQQQQQEKTEKEARVEG